jgi:hypothetical protein
MIIVTYQVTINGQDNVNTQFLPNHGTETRQIRTPDIIFT